MDCCIPKQQSSCNVVAVIFAHNTLACGVNNSEAVVQVNLQRTAQITYIYLHVMWAY